MERPRLDDATHTVLGDCAAGGLRAAGAGEVIALRDLLTRGPCDVDPERHRAARIAYWRVSGDEEARAGVLGAADLREALGRAAGPVVVWSASAWSERLALFWTCDALERMGFPRERLYLVDVDKDGAGDPRLRGSSLGAFPSEQLRAAFDRARPIDAAEIAEGAALWRSYAAPSPLGFDEARRRGSAVFRDLAAVAERFGDWFPRFAAEHSDRPRLSALDELLLSGFVESEPRTPLDALKLAGDAWIERIFPAYGDLCIVDRLAAWAAHTAATADSPALVAEPRDGASDSPALVAEPRDGANDFTNVAYRLTPAGAALLQRGLARPDDAPAFHIGGATLYDPARPWLRADDGDGAWRLLAPPARR